MTEMPTNQLRVLVIEDQPLIAMTIEMSINHLGHQMIGPIARLDEAMTAAVCEKYDCAVIDINIIGGCSFEVAEEISARNRPFVLATGYNEKFLPDSLKKFPRLTKPYSKEQLEWELKRMFDICHSMKS